MSNTAFVPLVDDATTSSVAEKSSTVVAITLVCSTVGELIDAYMAQYAGHDTSCPYRLSVWRTKLGALPLVGFTDDHVFAALEELAVEPARFYAGTDADGQPIHRVRGKRSAATVARYHSAMSAVFAWAIRKRRVPKGFGNPCHKVARPAGGRSIVRFLSDAERTRLLAACRASKRPRLYLLVLVAITTGARRGELSALRWRNIDFERAVAYVADTKNGEPRVLPLLPTVINELKRRQAEDIERFKVAAANMIVFHSRIKPDLPYHSEAVWQFALKAARVRGFRFHDLRHTCASYLAQSGASLLEIADVMGHKQLQMVQRYSHLTTSSKSALLNRVLGEIK